MKFRKRSQKKTYILPIIFSIMVMLMVLASCSVEGSVYRIQYPKFSFQPYSFPLGDESAYAEVTFLTSYDTDFPKVVEINGNIYYVAVFNGYKENVDLSQITTINVDDCIQAINSHAYEHATNVTTLSIPNVLSLGDASLPENLTTLTVNAEAIDTVGTRPLNISLPNPDKLESLTITGKTRYSIDLSCIGGKNSSIKEITLDADVPWPTMPHPTREGMKFIGWFTSDPSVDPDAEYAKAGEKPSTYPITVYPYFTPGIDEPETEPEKPTISIPSVFDIYPDTVADNAIVVGYAENALGDQTPITYPYTIYTSATPDSQGRYKASDLGLVPITVTTSADLNASGAKEAWWGKTATVGYYATENTSLDSVRFVDDVTEIGIGAFAHCIRLTNVTIPEDVTTIGNSAFGFCTGLTSITIPDSVTSIGSGAFYGCTGLTSITIPAGVTKIEDSTFNGCDGLTSITIPSRVASIGSYAFSNCDGLTSVTIPEYVTSIGENAFYGCDGLTSVTIPKGVTTIGTRAFDLCTNLTDIYVNQLESTLLDNASVSCTIHWNSTGPGSI